MSRIRTVTRWAALAAAASVLASCGSGVRFVRQDLTEYPAKPSDAAVEVHEGGVLTPHVVIGTFTAERGMKADYGDGSNLDRTLNDLRRAARGVGADALIHVRPVLSEKNMSRARIEITATAVRYLQPTISVTSEAGTGTGG
jgi:hypothetical protein